MFLKENQYDQQLLGTLHSWTCIRTVWFGRMGMGMGVGVGEIEEGLHKLGFAVNLCISEHNSG